MANRQELLDTMERIGTMSTDKESQSILMRGVDDENRRTNFLFALEHRQEIGGITDPEEKAIFLEGIKFFATRARK